GQLNSHPNRQDQQVIYLVIKWLAEEPREKPEGLFSEQDPDPNDKQHGDWITQRRCPHLKADLTRFGIVDGNTLTCQLHGWKFDLASGRCLTSVGHEIRASRADQPAPVRPAAG